MRNVIPKAVSSAKSTFRGAQKPSRITLWSAAVTLASLLSMGSASASIFSIQGGDVVSSWPANFSDGIATGQSVTIFSAPPCGTCGLYLTSNALLTFTFLKPDAGFTDSFSLNGGQLFQNLPIPTPTGQTTAPASFTAGLLNVAFELQHQGSSGLIQHIWTNGGSLEPQIQVAFYLPSNDPESVYLFLEDHPLSSSAKDIDFNDLVIKISDPDPTPLPAALPLLMTGMGVMGLLRYRKRKKSAAAAMA